MEWNTNSTTLYMESCNISMLNTMVYMNELYIALHSGEET